MYTRLCLNSQGLAGQAHREEEKSQTREQMGDIFLGLQVQYSPFRLEYYHPILLAWKSTAKHNPLAMGYWRSGSLKHEPESLTWLRAPFPFQLVSPVLMAEVMVPLISAVIRGNLASLKVRANKMQCLANQGGCWIYRMDYFLRLESGIFHVCST